MAKDNGEKKSLGKLKKQVDRTLEMSEVLAGKKPLGGKIGEKLKKKKNEESDLKKGKALRDKKFKQFDIYCERIENIANKHEEETKDKKHKIKIRRETIVNPKDPNKVI
jgi:hypothetical protein